MKQIIVHYINIKYIEENLDALLPFISNERITKANRYKNRNDQLLSLGAGYLLNKYLPNNTVLFNENGKPYIKDGPHFNLSHSGEYVVLAIDEQHEIGVDIQLIDEKNVSTIIAVSEISLSLDDMFMMWSNKESLIKCIGANMGIIKKVPGLPLVGLRKYLDESYYTYSQIFDGYSLSVTIKSEEPFITILKEVIREPYRT